jgi:hypothetical protein
MSLLGIIPLRPTHLKNREPPSQYWSKENCGLQAKTTRFPDGLIREINTQTSYHRKMLFPGIYDRWHIRIESQEYRYLRPRFNSSSQGSGQVCSGNSGINLNTESVKDVYFLIYTRIQPSLKP